MSQVRFHSPPARTVKRENMRWARQRPITRGRANDHEDGGTGTPATGATAGIPGTWTPPGSTPPSGPGAPMVGITASPATAWLATQYVQTRTSGNAGRVLWSGASWVGWVPGGMDFDPEDHTVVDVQSWVDDNPDYADEVLSKEEHGKQRVTLIDWLMGFIAHRDDDLNAVQ